MLRFALAIFHFFPDLPQIMCRNVFRHLLGIHRQYHLQPK